MWGRYRIVDDGNTGDPRPMAQRDADRILYSSDFRRLSGVTQVISSQDGHVLHGRLTHSLKVAEVAARITQRLKGEAQALVPYGPLTGGHAAAMDLDPDVTYAAALAHDLGHPPFGHAGEVELQAILAGLVGRDGSTQKATPIFRDSFEGNAQTFRIVTRTAVRKANEEAGLNLTWRTYAAIPKYPWLRGYQPAALAHLGKKWNAYDSEQNLLAMTRSRINEYDPLLEGPFRSLEAEIMDWADDIAYAVHDVEDFYRGGLIRLNTLAGGSEAWSDFLAYAEQRVMKAVRDVDASLTEADFKSLWQVVASNLEPQIPAQPYDGSAATRGVLHRFASDRIDDLMAGLSVRMTDSEPAVLSITPEARLLAELLKKLTWYFVIDGPSLATDQRGQRTLLRHLFYDLWDMSRDAWVGGQSSKKALPTRLEDFTRRSLEDEDMNVYGTDEARLARAVVDYLCTLTDRQAQLLSLRLSGHASGVSLQLTDR